jgi:hypothetical protein
MAVGRSPGLDALGPVAVDQKCVGAAVIEVSYAPSFRQIAASRQVKSWAKTCHRLLFRRHGASPQKQRPQRIPAFGVRGAFHGSGRFAW